MSDMKWTSEQKQVIAASGRDILVSAAAGSGKTAVLVERIIHKVIDEETDIDQILVVTFTRAAAQEMKERIRSAIATRAEENPDNVHLQKQATLIHSAQITTIDSFCTYVVKNHFSEIGLEPGFRIAEEGEVKLLREDTLDGIFRRHYDEGNERFLRLTDAYSVKDRDASVAAMVDQLFDAAEGYPDPHQWLEEIRDVYALSSEEALMQESWIKDFEKHVRMLLKDWIASLEQMLTICNAPGGPLSYTEAISADLVSLQYIASQNSLNEIISSMGAHSWTKLKRADKDTDPELKDQVSQMRKTLKGAFDDLYEQVQGAGDALYAQMLSLKPYADTLVDLTEEYLQTLDEKKRHRNILDFGDLEHMALQILTNEDGSPSEAATEFMEQYEEIMIDEYQDSNYLQEAILKSISGEHIGRHNLFMVGDVKQSIYGFRQARPDLFMEKLDQYPYIPLGAESDSPDQKIILSKNFRSRQEVLSITNDVFRKIMGKDLGGVEYSNEAALYYGGAYADVDSTNKMYTPEILIADSNKEDLGVYDVENNHEAEAMMVAARIHDLMHTMQVMDKKTGQLRPLQYFDIAILLRSPGKAGDTWVQTLLRQGIPAHMTSAEGYFDSTEVARVLAMLSVINNPQNDKDLIAVLLSKMGGFSNDDLLFIRGTFPERCFWQSFADMAAYADQNKVSLKAPAESVMHAMPADLEKRVTEFYALLEDFRRKSSYTPIHELIMDILVTTGYLDYVSALPDGDVRRANLLKLIDQAVAFEKTSYRGLYRFVHYIEELREYQVDYGTAELIGENDDAVRIMSIHKSKGLEFPVVFLSDLGGRFNRNDLKGSMLIDAKAGMALDLIDPDKRTKEVPLYKSVVKERIAEEDLGEELRVLYVGMTRAREKLILTAALRNAEDQLEKARLTGKSSEDGQLPFAARIKANAYLGWILPALYSYGSKYENSIRVISVSDIVGEMAEQFKTDQIRKDAVLALGRKADTSTIHEIRERLNYQYPYQGEDTYKTKYSVSEIKYRAMDLAYADEQARPAFRKPPANPAVPHFIREQSGEQTEGIRGFEKQVSKGALRGTAMHRVMECFDFAREDYAVSLQDQMTHMKSTGRLSEEQASLVNTRQLEQFLTSDLAKRMHKASCRGEYHAEEPFVMGGRPEEFFAVVSEEKPIQTKVEDKLSMPREDDRLQTRTMDDMILVQGIIDGFFREPDGMVLLDYKTDHVADAEELVLRYQAQMKLYAMAIERTYHIPVKESILYSFSLACEVPVTS